MKSNLDNERIQIHTQQKNDILYFYLWPLIFVYRFYLLLFLVIFYRSKHKLFLTWSGTGNKVDRIRSRG